MGRPLLGCTREGLPSLPGRQIGLGLVENNLHDEANHFAYVAYASTRLNRYRNRYRIDTFSERPKDMLDQARLAGARSAHDGQTLTSAYTIAETVLDGTTSQFNVWDMVRLKVEPGRRMFEGVGSPQSRKQRATVHTRSHLPCPEPDRPFAVFRGLYAARSH